MNAWKTYLWLTFIGLMASAVNWSTIVRDENGRLRWGTIAFQIPLAFSIGVMSHDLLMPLAAADARSIVRRLCQPCGG